MVQPPAEKEACGGQFAAAGGLCSSVSLGARSSLNADLCVAQSTPRRPRGAYSPAAGAAAHRELPGTQSSASWARSVTLAARYQQFRLWLQGTKTPKTLRLLFGAKCRNPAAPRPQGFHCQAIQSDSEAAVSRTGNQVKTDYVELRCGLSPPDFPTPPTAPRYRRA